MVSLEFWHWWVLALVFVVIEALAPSGVFTAMALAGGIIGGMILYFPEMTWQAQLGGFAAFLMVLSYPMTALYRRKINNKGSVYEAASKVVGKEIELTMPIQNGFGEIDIDGSIWGLKGPDVKKGEKVRVVGLDGDMLVVVPIKPKVDEDQIER